MVYVVVVVETVKKAVASITFLRFQVIRDNGRVSQSLLDGVVILEALFQGSYVVVELVGKVLFYPTRIIPGVQDHRIPICWGVIKQVDIFLEFSQSRFDASLNALCLP